MKKILSLLIIAMFVISLSAVAFAANDDAGNQGTSNSDATPTVTAVQVGNDTGIVAKRVTAMPKERVQNMRAKYQEARARLQQNNAQMRERLAKAKNNRVEAKARHAEAKGKIEGRRAQLSACKDDESADCEALRKETRTHTRNYLSGVAEHVLGMIAKTQERVQNSKMPEDQKAEMMARLDAKAEEIAGALEASESLTEESSKEEFQEVASIIKESWKGTKDEIKKGAGQVAANKIRALNTRMNQLQTKLERTLERLENAGEDTSAAQAQLDAFKAKLEQSKAAEQAAQTKYQSGDAAGAVEKTKEAHRSLVEAHKSLKQLVQTIKRARGGEDALRARNQNREQTSGEDALRARSQNRAKTGQEVVAEETEEVITPTAVFPDTNVTE